MRARRENLRDARRLEARFRASERRPKTRTARTDDDDVILMIVQRIGLADLRRRGARAIGLAIHCRHQPQAPKLSFKIENTLASAMNIAKKVLSIKAATLSPSSWT